MSGRPPKWFYAWALWMGLGACVGLVSLGRTQFPPPPPPRDPRPALSGNGEWLAVEVPRRSGGVRDIVRYPLNGDRPERIDQGFHGQPVNDSSLHPSLDHSGQRLAFASLASDWVEGDDNSVSDIFLWEKGRVQRLLPPHPEPGRSSSCAPRLSPQGDRVAFLSYGWPGSNKEQGRQVCLWSPAGVQLLGPHEGPALGPVAFGPEGASPVFTLLSHRGPQLMLPQGRLAGYQPALARDRSFFVSLANRCHQIFELSGEKPQLLSKNPAGVAGSDSSFEPCCSASGNEVAFTSYATNLGVAESSHILLWNRGQGLQCLSSGLPGPHFHPAISANGQRVIWVAGTDLYFWERGRGRRRLALSL